MTPELWERLNPLFDQVIEVPTSQRRALVTQLCGEDVELQKELLALVGAHEWHDEATKDLFVATRHIISEEADRLLSAGECLLGRFTIVRRLGKGGMGDVYEAFDSELSHPVALKMIRCEIARNDGGLTRFKTEVQLARRISGPNICRIHELFILNGNEGIPGGAFLTMELLHGVTLAEALTEGQFPREKAEQIALDICRGLTAIHDAGIIHRDLKTRNIMLVDRGKLSTAVLMDFGLAREISELGTPEQTNLTARGSILGTPDYMAPEQFEDGRLTSATDIYALGVVLYEIATGKHPFESSNPLGAAVRRAKRPEPVASINRKLPHRWDRVIKKCLEYDAAKRFQSAAEVARILDAPVFGVRILGQNASANVLLPAGLALAGFTLIAMYARPANELLRGFFAPREKHIAVLPFEVVGSDQELATQGDGLMDALTGKLANLDRANQNLWVVPASEIRRRKIGTPQSAFKEFGATMVVRGRFSRLDHMIRLTLELIDSGKMREIGFADIDSSDENLAALQDEAVQRLGRLMNVSVDKSLRGDEAGAIGSSYNHYVAGLGYLERYDKPGNLEGAVRALSSAVEASPRFAPALGALCRTYTLKFQIDSNPEALKSARDYCARAIAVDEQLPGLHANLALLDKIEGHYDLAAQEFQRIIELDPGNVDALTGLAELYWRSGQLKDAEKFYIRATVSRSQDWKGYNALAIFYDRIGRHRQAIENYKHALDLTPDNAFVYCNLGGAYLNSNDRALFAEADKALMHSIALNPSYEAYANLGNVYLLQRKFRDSADASEKALKMDGEDYSVWSNLLEAYEQLGDQKGASAARKQIQDLAQGAIRLNDKNADAHSMLAMAMAKNHQRELAISHIRTALALEPENQSVLAQVAEAYEALGERRLALQYLQGAIRNGFPKLQVTGDANLERVAADPRFQAG